MLSEANSITLIIAMHVSVTPTLFSICFLSWTVEADSGNGYAQGWGMLLMISIIVKKKKKMFSAETVRSVARVLPFESAIFTPNES